MYSMLMLDYGRPEWHSRKGGGGTNERIGCFGVEKVGFCHFFVTSLRMKGRGVDSRRYS